MEASACPVISAYVEHLGDWASDEQRQQLRAFLPKLIGSRSAEHVVPRAEFLARQAMTVFLPLMYHMVKQPKIAAALRALPPVVTPAQFKASIRSENQSFSADAITAAATAAAYAADATAYATYAADASAAYVAAAEDAAVDAAAYVAATAAAAATAAVVYVAVADDADIAGMMAIRQVARQKLWQAALAALDGALAIGPFGPAALTTEMKQRLSAYLAHGGADRVQLIARRTRPL
jgi:hypothetical protein